MKKSLTALLISIMALTVGCSSTSTSTHAEEVSTIHSNLSHVNMKKIHKAIDDGAEKSGWITTEYKSNEVIAEKIDGEDSIMVSIKIENGRLKYLQENEEATSDIDDLSEAISEEIHKGSSTH